MDFSKKITKVKTNKSSSNEIIPDFSKVHIEDAEFIAYSTKYCLEKSSQNGGFNTDIARQCLSSLSSALNEYH